MIRTIIADDEQSGINTLRKILVAYCPEVHIIATCNNADTTKAAIEAYLPDLVLLDISMPGKSSLEMLAEIKDINFQIIFVTAHNEYSLQAIKFSAVDYLLKPVHEDDLVAAIKKVTSKVESGYLQKNIETLLHNLQLKNRQEKVKVCIPSLKGFLIIVVDEIIYCQAESSYTIFHLENGQKITASKPIIDYEELLEQNNFVRTHRFFLVNLNHVVSYERGEGGMITVSNGQQLEVSRRKKEIFINAIKNKFRY